MHYRHSGNRKKEQMFMKPRVEAIAGNSGVMNPARKPTRLIIRHQGSKLSLIHI